MGLVVFAPLRWLLSPNNFNNNNANEFNVNSSGNLNNNNVNNTGGVRPSVSLAPGVVVSDGNGTAANPFTILANDSF